MGGHTVDPKPAVARVVPYTCRVAANHFVSLGAVGNDVPHVLQLPPFLVQ